MQWPHTFRVLYSAALLAATAAAAVAEPPSPAADEPALPASPLASPAITNAASAPDGGNAAGVRPDVPIPSDARVGDANAALPGTNALPRPEASMAQVATGAERTPTSHRSNAGAASSEANRVLSQLQALVESGALDDEALAAWVRAHPDFQPVLAPLAAALGQWRDRLRRAEEQAAAREDELRKAQREFAATHAGLMARIAEAAAAATESMKKRGELGEALTTARRECRDLSRKAADLDDQLELLTRENTKRREALTASQARVAELTQKLADQERKAEDHLARASGEAGRKLEAEKELHAQLRRQVKDLQAAVERAEREAGRRVADALRQANGELTAAVAARDRQLAELAATVKSLENDIVTAKDAGAAEAQRVEAALREEATALRRALDEAEKAAARRAEEDRKARAALEAELQAARKTASDAVRKAEDLRSGSAVTRAGQPPAPTAPVPSAAGDTSEIADELSLMRSALGGRTARPALTNAPAVTPARRQPRSN